MKSQSKFMDHTRKETTINQSQQKHEQLETKRFKKWNWQDLDGGCLGTGSEEEGGLKDDS